MEVIKSDLFSKYKSKPTVVAIGSFDGLHKGHQKIIKKTIKIAEEKRMDSGVFSFFPHPLEVIAPDKSPSFLISRRQKINILEKMGIDYFFEQEFNEEFSKLNFREFISNILIDKIGVEHIVVGSDFKFGKDQTGNTEKLKNMSKNNKIDTTIIPVIKKKTSKISSTYIRKLIKEGRVNEVKKYLGRNYKIEGKVVTGEGRGRKLGIPTANLNLSTDYVLPPKGVYAAKVYHKKEQFKAVVNFGEKPTFSSENYTIEVHILDLDKNFYGELLEVELYDFIREERKFSNEDELISQIKSDILYTRNILC
ncbi:MAG: bifunctional riboflavin kinase/FAD synthetase [Bacillota bacterium]